MNDCPVVSVLVPTYNHEKYLEEAIDSILMQDYGNIQIVISDDYSSDGARNIVSNYLEKYPNRIIGILAEKNEGVTVNCNRALEKCTGKYIAMFSGDDVLLGGYISTMVNHMEADPECSICYSNSEVFDSGTGKRLYLYNSRLRKARSGDVRALIKYGSFNSACATMVRSSKIPKSGFDKRYPVASDWFLFVQVLLNGGEIHYSMDVN